MNFRLSHGLVGLSALIGLSAAAPAGAQMSEAPAPACTAPAVPTGELAPWASPIALDAAASPAKLAAATIAPGTAAQVTLLPTPSVVYPLRPEKPGGSVSFGGLIGVTIREAGIYRVALSSGAWIDLVRDGTPTRSAGHGHGPACTPIRKMVDFPLTPGGYTLQIGANGQSAITVLVAPLPPASRP